MRNDSPRLLLVEEDKTLAEITSFRLELLGYDVRMAESGEEALEMIRDELPDLFMLDLCLPGMDGFELINILKNDPNTNGLPIMAFSTDANPESVERAFAAGATDYLVTPYDPAVLQRKVEQQLDPAGKTT